MYKPTMSRTFSTNCGSGESLKVSARCGCNPKVFQMRWIVVWDNPTSFAMARCDPCVRPRGVVSSVLVITASTFASVACRGAPGRGSSSRASRPPTRYRSRHLHTLFLLHPTFFAT
jgi:hypothetical protein